PPIPGKSRMRERACTDLCGGRSAMVVPTATVRAKVPINARIHRNSPRLRARSLYYPQSGDSRRTYEYRLGGSPVTWMLEATFPVELAAFTRSDSNYGNAEGVAFMVV